MLRKMLATTAVVALMTTPVIAQDDNAQADMTTTESSNATESSQASGSTQASATVDESDMLASNFIGKTIYTSANDDAEAIGDVEDVILSQDGNVDAVVVSVGGFLGIAEKTVALPFDRLSMEMRDGEEWIVANASSEELTQMEEFDAAMLEPDQGNMSEDDTAAAENDADANQNMAASSDNADDRMNETAEGDQAESMQDDEAAETEQNAAMSDAENQQAGDTAGMESTTGAATSTGMASSEQAANTEAANLRDGLQPADQGGLSTDSLIGTTVYGAQDEALGDINDVILGEDKSIQAYVIDVGGFLGIGEKPVALSPDAIEVMQQPESQDYVVFTKFTEEQLEQQNEYSEEAYRDNPDDVLMR